MSFKTSVRNVKGQVHPNQIYVIFFTPHMMLNMLRELPASCQRLAHVHETENRKMLSWMQNTDNTEKNISIKDNILVCFSHMKHSRLNWKIQLSHFKRKDQFNNVFSTFPDHDNL